MTWSLAAAIHSILMEAMAGPGRSEAQGDQESGNMRPWGLLSPGNSGLSPDTCRSPLSDLSQLWALTDSGKRPGDQQGPPPTGSGHGGSAAARTAAGAGSVVAAALSQAGPGCSSPPWPAGPPPGQNIEHNLSFQGREKPPKGLPLLGAEEEPQSWINWRVGRRVHSRAGH